MDNIPDKNKAPKASDGTGASSSKKRGAAAFILDILKGALIGVGAILPGISGGVLCVVFGIYRPMMEFLSHPAAAFKKYRSLLIPVLIGWVIGFLGLARLVEWLFRTSQAPAVWLFVGLIVGTLPSLWRSSGERGRGNGYYIAMCLSFAAMLALLIGLGGARSGAVTPNVWWWVLSGALWGIGLIVPGMSASPILIWLGLYAPMTAGIANLNLGVILPMGAGLLAVVLGLSRAVTALFERAHSIVYSALLGVVAASIIAIVPIDAPYAVSDCVVYAFCFAAGLAAALLMDRAGERMPEA